MINESEFLALIAAAGDLDDLRNNQCFVFRRPAEARKFVRILRAWAADDDSAAITKGTRALEEWARSKATGGLKLRDSSKLPDWTWGLRRMLVHLPQTKADWQGSLAQRLARPAIAFGRAELQGQLGQQDFFTFPPGVLHCFEKQLENRLIRTIGSCLELELRVFESAFRCVFHTRGELSQEEIEREFIGENAADRLNLLFRGYPALAKLWSQSIQNWAENISELASRLRADRRTIQQIFFRGRDPGDLVDVTMNISDPHRGGRETVILRFQNGSVVYKPRSGRSENDWFSFVRWINRQGSLPSLRTLKLLLRGDYCWMEFIEPRPCRSEIEVRRYYRRAGGLICAAYMLGAIDCHRDNLIAAGDQPVLIDTETLLHPETPHSARNKSGGSLIRTGLLPIPKSLSRPLTDISAFGGAPGKHTPTLNGKLLAPSNYSADALRGFSEMWKLIGEPTTQTRAAFRRRLRRLADRPWRRLYLSTRTYFEIRDRSLNAQALSSGFGRTQYIARDLLRRGVGASVILEEISALQRLDVPYFLEAPDKSQPGPDFLLLSELTKRVRSALGNDVANYTGM